MVEERDREAALRRVAAPDALGLVECLSKCAFIVIKAAIASMNGIFEESEFGLIDGDVRDHVGVIKGILHELGALDVGLNNAARLLSQMIGGGAVVFYERVELAMLDVANV